MRVRLSAHKPGLSPLVTLILSLTVPRRYSNLFLNECLFVSVCLLCFCNHLYSCSFLVLVLCCSGGCLLCMLSFLNELFPFIVYMDVNKNKPNKQCLIVLGNTKLCPLTVIHHAAGHHGILGHYGQNCYELLPRYDVTWSHGERLCQQEGGHLAHISSADEQSFVQEFMTNHSPDHGVWIGLNDRDQEGQLQWSSGHTLFPNYLITCYFHSSA